LISWSEFLNSKGFSHLDETPTVHVVVASLFAAIIGSVSFWGSLIAFGNAAGDPARPAADAVGSAARRHAPAHVGATAITRKVIDGSHQSAEKPTSTWIRGANDCRDALAFLMTKQGKARLSARGSCGAATAAAGDRQRPEAGWWRQAGVDLYAY
jgi:hypothetical protein